MSRTTIKYYDESGTLHVYDNYEIDSDTFEVYSKPRQGSKGGPIKRHITEDGYIKVILCENRKLIGLQLHRIIMSTFADPPEYFPCDVDHIDHDRSNNSISNLRWWHDNRKDPIVAEKVGKKLINHPSFSKRVQQVDPDTNKVVRVYESAAEVGRVLDINQRTIDRACREHTKRYGYYWVYEQR